MTCAMIGVGLNVTLLLVWPANRTCLEPVAGPVCTCDWPALNSLNGFLAVLWPGPVSAPVSVPAPGSVVGPVPDSAVLRPGSRVRLGGGGHLGEGVGCRRGPRRLPELCLDGNRPRSIRSHLVRRLCSCS